MANIRRRGNKWLVAVFVGGLRKSASFGSQEEAIQWGDETEGMLRQSIMREKTRIRPPSLKELKSSGLRDKLLGAVYFLFDEYGELLYVGQTGDLHRRLVRHREQRSFATWTAFMVDDKERRIVLEQHYIDKYKPRENLVNAINKKTGIPRTETSRKNFNLRQNSG